MDAHTMNRCLSTILFAATCLVPLTAGAAPRANPTVKFELEDGAKVSDTVTIAAKATSPDDAGIEKVEFYVDNQLKYTDSSTPYELTWDTLAETEGAHALKAVAFDAKGNTATAKVSL